MRPIRLEISGLNSYIEKQVVDFSELTSRGLFGIFGKTGSGKSTTLAAMIDFISSMRNCHILTIDDPIEYVYQQKQALIHHLTNQRNLYILR